MFPRSFLIQRPPKCLKCLSFDILTCWYYETCWASVNDSAGDLASLTSTEIYFTLVFRNHFDLYAPPTFGWNYLDCKKGVNKVEFLSCGRQARLYHLMWRMVQRRRCTSLQEIFFVFETLILGWSKSKMKIWMKDVWCVKNKRPAVGSDFPYCIP